MSVASGKPINAGQTARLEHEDLTLPETKRVLNYGWDGTQKVRMAVDTTGAIRPPLYASKITESGNYTYVANALPGTAQATAAWRVMRVDVTSGTVITWADGNANFDNVATDLTALSYS